MKLVAEGTLIDKQLAFSVLPAQAGDTFSHRIAVKRLFSGTSCQFPIVSHNTASEVIR